jgi:polar amino acid transport system permease protein
MDLSFYTQEVAPAMLRGLWVSIGLILPSAVFGLALGVLAGTSGFTAVPSGNAQPKSTGFSFRGFPPLVQLYIWYFGLPQMGIYLSPYAAAVLGFSLCAGPITRSTCGGLAIHQAGPMQAAVARLQPFPVARSILLPQAIRRAPAGLRQRAHLPDQAIPRWPIWSPASS